MGKSFPDWTEEIVDIIAEGDKIVTSISRPARIKGGGNGIDSTGNRVTIYETSIYRIADGKIAEQLGSPNEISLRNHLQKK